MSFRFLRKCANWRQFGDVLAPDQVCQFHALRDASQPAFAADKKIRTALRKHIQPRVRAVRKQLKQQIPQVSAKEAEQLAALDDYASRMLPLVEQVSRLDRARWRELRRETTVAQREQLTRFRFRHKREAFLASLEERWAAASST